MRIDYTMRVDHNMRMDHNLRRWVGMRRISQQCAPRKRASFQTIQPNLDLGFHINNEPSISKIDFIECVSAPAGFRLRLSLAVMWLLFLLPLSFPTIN